MKIGVLALQGGYVEHLNALKKISGIEGVPVKKEIDLLGLEGLILPVRILCT